MIGRMLQRLKWALQVQPEYTIVPYGVNPNTMQPYLGVRKDFKGVVEILHYFAFEHEAYQFVLECRRADRD